MRVLPEPVFAAPRISAPFSEAGIPLACIVVSLVNCDSFRPDCVGLESGSSAKVVGGVEGFGSRFATRLDSASKSSSSRFLFRLLAWLKIGLRPF